MAFPVMADDDRTYERAAIVTWLKKRTTSPLDPSSTISVASLRKNRVVTDLIEDLVKTDAIDDETKEVWQEKRDEPQSLFCEGRFLEAANLGHVEAMVMLAVNYYYGEGGVAEDNAKAFDFATKAAKEGNAEGMSILGDCYSCGHGVAMDKKAGMKWYEEAAKKGDIDCALTCGERYSAGEICVKNDKKAAKYFKIASDKGCGCATNELGNCYYEGAGVPKNLKTARVLFGKAADDEDSYSAGDVNLGTMMIRGEGGAKEVGRGFMLIEKAAEHACDVAIARLKEIKGVVKRWEIAGICKFDT